MIYVYRDHNQITSKTSHFFPRVFKSTHTHPPLLAGWLDWAEIDQTDKTGTNEERERERPSIDSSIYSFIYTIPI